jgi:hypothetical protein
MPQVTMRCTLISRNFVEKPALSRPPCSAVLILEDIPDGSVELPICDSCNRTDHQILFSNPSSPLQESAFWPTCQLVLRPHHTRRHPNGAGPPLCCPGPYPIKLSFGRLSQSSISTRIICRSQRHPSSTSQAPPNDVSPSIRTW